MTNSRKPLLGLIAVGAAVAMPMAFAQEATPTPQNQDPAQSTAPAATQQPLTWADLDVDGNGTLSQTEAGNLQSLAQVFNDADSDSDGELTPDEYKAYVASTNASQPEAGGGND